MVLRRPVVERTFHPNEAWRRGNLTFVSGPGARTLSCGVTSGTREGPAIDIGRLRQARDLVFWLLSGNVEARSLYFEARHRRVLAEQSVAAAAEAASEADRTRIRHEALRHRLDPLGRRPVRCSLAIPLVVLLGAVLGGPAWIDLAGLPSGRLLGAMAAAAAWLAAAWLAAIASRERRGRLLRVAIAGAVIVAGLIAALQGAGTAPGRPGDWGTGVLGAVLSLALTAVAGLLTARAEPAAVALARGRLRRARAAHDAAVRVMLADTEAAAIARESWLSLVRVLAASAAGGDAQLTEDAVAVAADIT
jgi:hypothetical protein